MSQWFLVRNGQQHGPITDQQLKDLAAKGRIQPTDQVRRDDMPNPVLAGTIRGLAFAAPPVMPPAPQPATTVEDPSKAALSGLLTFCLIIGISGFVVYRVVTKNSGKRAAAHQGLPDLKDVPEGDLIFADRLYSQYQGNEVGADQQYKGKTIVVFGDVASVESPCPFGKPVILIRATGSGRRGRLAAGVQPAGLSTERAPR